MDQAVLQARARLFQPISASPTESHPINVIPSEAKNPGSNLDRSLAPIVRIGGRKLKQEQTAIGLLAAIIIALIIGGIIFALIAH
jgi:hypothetical protein